VIRVLCYDKTAYFHIYAQTVTVMYCTNNYESMHSAITDSESVMHQIHLLTVVLTR